MQGKQCFKQLHAPLLICRLSWRCLHARNAADSTWTQVGVQLIDHQARGHGLPRSVPDATANHLPNDLKTG